MEFIDVTPTWSALLPVMLEIAENGAGTGLRDEFVKMAQAADKWNAAVKANRIIAEETDARS